MKVFEGDGLPNKICHPCKYQLEKSYSFRKKCENSDLKLRQHLKYLQEKIGDVSPIIEEEPPEEVRESNEQEEVCMKSEEQPSTEEDLVGVTQVAYIHPDNDPEEDAENITLPPETELINKEACTLSAVPKKEIIDVDANDSSSIYMVDDQSMETDNNVVGEPDYDAIADAVKATLAAQPGINVEGELQMKVNQQIGRLTQVEVTTEDGSVIVIELMTEDDNDGNDQEHSGVDEEGELKIFQVRPCYLCCFIVL